MIKRRVLGKRFPLATLVVAVLALALLALACEEEEEEATPTPPVAETPTEAATPTVLAPGAAGIPSNPRDVRGLEGLITLDDGLAVFKERPADEDRTGVTDDTIKLGRTTGITGWLAPYEPGWGPIQDALIKRINEAGGIHGRKIELIIKDDAGDAALGVQATKELVEGDKVFALFFAVGSPTHNAVHEYHVQQGVPTLFYLDASNVGMEPVTSKWDFNGQNSDIIGGMVLAEAVYMQQPDAKVAIVYGDFPASQAGRDGIRYAAQLAGQEIVAEFSHDITQVDLTAQAQQVADTDADWVIYHGSFTQAVNLINNLRETVGWQGNIAQWGAVPGAGVDEIIDGTTQVTFQATPFGHPDLPIWPKIEALAEEEGIPFIPTLGPIAIAAVEHLIRALELAGPDLTREGLVEAIDVGFDGSWQCNTCAGPTILGPQDHWANETWLLTTWNNAAGTYDILGVVSHETSKGLGLRGNFPGLDCQPPSAEFPEGTCPWQQES